MKNKRGLLSCFIMIFTIMITLRVYAADIPSSKRIAGSNRYSTAVEISKEGWQSSNNVIIATGEDFPDALCAAPLAKQLDAPILLTGKNTLNANTGTELTRLITKKVYIIGGPGVVSDTVKQQIESKGIACERIFGNNRYATSIEVAKRLNHSSEIVVATGSDFPDALSIAPIAAKNGMPIILANKINITNDVRTYINSKNITKSYIIGGTGVITDNVKAEFPFPNRIDGSNRYETNIAILKYFNSELNFTTSYLATGNDFPDALAGSSLAPKSMSPIILTSKTPGTVTKNYVFGKLSSITSLNILGGTGVIPNTVISTLLGGIKETGTLKVNYIDVGQGDSILIQQGSNSMLIDAGNNADSELVKKHIIDQGITKLDYVIGTHPHEDHIGGLDFIINNFQIGKIYMPKVTSTTQTFEDVVTAINNKGMVATVPTPGESFKLGDAICVILAPNGSGYEDTNNDSIVIKISFGENSFLFTGDAEGISENEMLSKGYDLKADVLKVGHHGSASSTTQQFINAVNPKYAVISVGKENTYGHPAKETIDKLISQNISVYRTDESGDITANSDGTNITFNVNPSEKPIEQSNTDVSITSINLESEIVTIKNSGTTDVDMTGWKLLSTEGMQNYDLPNDFILKAGTTIYITSGGNAIDDGKVYLKWTGSYIWNNDGDLGELYDSNNGLVSSK